MGTTLERPESPVRRLYNQNPQAFVARLCEEARTLFTQSYRVEPSSLFGIFDVWTPQGKRVLVDHYAGICDCSFSKDHWLPCGCKHLIGLERLVLTQTMHLQQQALHIERSLPKREHSPRAAQIWKQAAALTSHWRAVQEKLMLQRLE